MRIPAGVVTLSTRQVSKQLGITERQLNHWVARGYIPGLEAHGPGSSLHWLPQHVAHAAAIRDAIERLTELTGPEMRRGWSRGQVL